MNRRIVAVAAITAVLVIAVVLWKRTGADAPAPTGAAAPATERAPREPAPETSRDGERTAAPAPRAAVFHDDDPAGPLRLEGQVIDQEDRAIAGAVVTLDSRPPRATTSAEDGSFAFDALVGRSYQLTAHAGAQIGGPVAYRLTAVSEPAVIRVRTGAALTATVVDAAGGPVAGAIVTLRDGHSRDEAVDADGKARFVGVAAGWQTIVAHAPGHGPTHQAVLVGGAPGAEVAVRLTLRPGAAVSGRVLDERGAPIAGARVIARDSAAAFGQPDPRVDGILTDERGAFTLPALAAGTHRLQASHPDFLPGLSAPLSTDGRTARTGIDIRVERGAHLAGVVENASGQPVPWATVRVGPERAGNGPTRQGTAGEDGRFRIEALPEVAMRAVARSEEAASEIVGVDLGRGDVDDVTLVLSIDGAIAGIVVDSAGEPIAEAQVTLTADFWKDTSSADAAALRGTLGEITDGGGRFRFTGLPAGPYQLHASRAGASIEQYNVRGTRARTGEDDVRLVLPANGTLRGKVAFASGETPAIFTVTLGFPPGVPVSTDDGAFEIPDVPPGSYDVTFRGPAFAEKRVAGVTIEEGQPRDLGTVVVPRGRTVRGRVLDASGSPVAGALVVIGTRLHSDGDSLNSSAAAITDELFGARRVTSDAGGAFALRGLGPEAQVLAAESEGGRSLPAAVPAGTEDVQQDLLLAPPGSIVGTVTAGGEPTTAIIAVNPVGNGDASIVVEAGPDGAFVVERLPPGPHRVTALLQASGASARSVGKEVEVASGERTEVTLDIPLGDVTLTVALTAADEVAPTVAQVFLLPAGVSPKNGGEVQTALLAASEEGSAMMKFWSPEAAAVFDAVATGTHSVCALPINGDMGDPAFASRVQRHATSLSVYCQPVEVTPSPAAQRVSMAVPAMQPLPAE